MQMKFYSPLTADFFPNEPDYEDEFYDEYEGYPQDGHELLEYETAIRDAVENDIRDFGSDLMQYYHEDDSVRNKVVTAVPSVEVHKTNPDSPRIQQVNTALKQLRQEERLCRKIAEHSLEVQQHLTEARRDRAEQQKQERERARDRRPNIDLTL